MGIDINFNLTKGRWNCFTGSTSRVIFDGEITYAYPCNCRSAARWDGCQAVDRQLVSTLAIRYVTARSGVGSME